MSVFHLCLSAYSIDNGFIYHMDLTYYLLIWTDLHWNGFVQVSIPTILWKLSYLKYYCYLLSLLTYETLILFVILGLFFQNRVFYHISVIIKNFRVFWFCFTKMDCFYCNCAMDCQLFLLIVSIKVSIHTILWIDSYLTYYCYLLSLLTYETLILFVILGLLFQNRVFYHISVIIKNFKVFWFCFTKMDCFYCNGAMDCQLFLLIVPQYLPY